jgi:hypothetical protein
MRPEDVKFSDRLTKVFKNLKGLPRTKEGDLWDDQSIEDYILDKKEEYLMEFEMSIASRIDYIHPEFGFEGRKRGMVKVKNLIVDCIEEKGNGNRYSIKVGMVEVDNFMFVGFTVGMMAWAGKVQNKIFKFSDLNINHIHDNIDITNSIQDSDATEYIKDMIKPNPIMDKLDKEERDLFKGVF